MDLAFTIHFMRSIVSTGAYPVSLPPAIEIFWGRVKCPTAADFKSEVYLWYLGLESPLPVSTDWRSKKAKNTPEYRRSSKF